MQELSRQVSVLRIDEFRTKQELRNNRPAPSSAASAGLTIDLEMQTPVKRPIFDLKGHDCSQARASEFSIQVAGLEYARELLNIMNPPSGWTVLDVEGASGALSIPLAHRVRSVTALDFSRDRLDLLKRRCRERGISNISALLARRETVRDVGDLGRYDAVVVSGASLLLDLPFSIMALNGVATRKMMVSASVGDGPFDRRIFEATGRKLEMGPSFTSIYYDVLHRYLGILADIAFVRVKGPNEWASPEEALESQKWMFQNLTDEEEEKIRLFLKDQLIEVAGKWVLPYEREYKWAVMSWEKDEPRAREPQSDRKSRRRVSTAGSVRKTRIAFR